MRVHASRRRYTWRRVGAHRRHRSGKGAGRSLSRLYDAEGVTAKFNLNLLVRINRELGANFDLAAFEHHAFYNAERHRIEMHLASTKRQRVRIGDTTVEFRAGETIHTENSYKYSIESFQALARGSGWSPLKVWTDGLFSVHALRMTQD